MFCHSTSRMQQIEMRFILLYEVIMLPAVRIFCYAIIIWPYINYYYLDFCEKRSNLLSKWIRLFYNPVISLSFVLLYNDSQRRRLYELWSRRFIIPYRTRGRQSYLHCIRNWKTKRWWLRRSKCCPLRCASAEGRCNKATQYKKNRELILAFLFFSYSFRSLLRIPTPILFLLLITISE